MTEAASPIKQGELLGKPINSGEEELRVMPDSLRHASEDVNDIASGLKKELCQGHSSTAQTVDDLKSAGFDCTKQLSAVLDEREDKVERLGKRGEYFAEGSNSCADSYGYLDETNAYGINSFGQIAYR